MEHPRVDNGAGPSRLRTNDCNLLITRRFNTNTRQPWTGAWDRDHVQRALLQQIRPNINLNKKYYTRNVKNTVFKIFKLIKFNIFF